jgi:hypothetical protein
MTTQNRTYKKTAATAHFTIPKSRELNMKSSPELWKGGGPASVAMVVERFDEDNERTGEPGGTRTRDPLLKRIGARARARAMQISQFVAILRFCSTTRQFGASFEG